MLSEYEDLTTRLNDNKRFLDFVELYLTEDML